MIHYLYFNQKAFGRNQDDLDVVYDNMKKAYLEIFETLGLNAQPVGADNGTIGGSRSEEFMCVSDIGEDNILFDSTAGKAFNSELLERPDCREYVKTTCGIEDIDSLETRKAVELGHIFQLKDKYASSMNATYIDETDKQKNFVMGCYGIGVSRTLAMVYEKSLLMRNGRFDGIALPINISSYLLYIVPKFDDKIKTEQSVLVYKLLAEKGVTVLYDDRLDLSIGAKIKDSKIVGTPYVAVFEKTLDHGFIEVENNLTGEKTELNIEQFVTSFIKLQQDRTTSIEGIGKKL